VYFPEIGDFAVI